MCHFSNVNILKKFFIVEKALLQSTHQPLSETAYVACWKNRKFPLNSFRFLNPACAPEENPMNVVTPSMTESKDSYFTASNRAIELCVRPIFGMMLENSAPRFGPKQLKITSIILSYSGSSNCTYGRVCKITGQRSLRITMNCQNAKYLLKDFLHNSFRI